MHSSSSLSQSQREDLVGLFEKGFGSKSSAGVLGVSRRAVNNLYDRWCLRGRLCLMDKPTKQSYSFHVKKEIVERFLAGETTMDLAREYQLTSTKLLQKWVRDYRRDGDAGLMPKPKGRPKGSAASGPVSEEDRLRRQVKRLEAENAYLKKLRDFRNQGHA